MHFHKFLHPANFEFPAGVVPNRTFKTRTGNCRITARACAGDIYHICVTGDGWETNDSQAGLRFPRVAKGLKGDRTQLAVDSDGRWMLRHHDGVVLLESATGRLFGRCGGASLFEFNREEGDQFYGLGEKWTGFEHSGKTTKFWNTDAFADFYTERVAHGKPDPDPVYVSVPYLILKRGNTYLGLLLDNPHATFVSTGFRVTISKQMKLHVNDNQIHLGAEAGQPNLYLLYGPSLAELTRRLQRLIGSTPLPPAWALGFHQCRWGYRSESDLADLDAKFRRHAIPVDGLWLDIDYMDGYRVFTFDGRHFPRPAQALEKLAAAGRKVVPIIDPGVKQEAGYGVYERGRAARAFCRNPQGGEYVGLVWPGQTVFPDFSLASVRNWWAREVTDFARLGIPGVWLDMNDPSTGMVDTGEMLFDRGRKSHDAYHNQYALGMAQATRQGLLEARPEQRPFVLSRSGFTGSGRYTAIWTGDNVSNYHHLKNSIATTLNLALSGIPFNGPDVGGFWGEASAELMRDWFKAGFLFPFFRNHTVNGGPPEEPWAFDKKTLAILRRYIRLRYRLRPYLYQLFAEHERSGEAILRPLFYDFEDSKSLPLGLIDDQFLVGPHILQAPFVVEKQARRKVVLPGPASWHSPMEGRWLQGRKKITAAANAEDTPLFIRDGAILPLARLEPHDFAFHGARADFHLFLDRQTEAVTRYVFDDGETFAYRGKQRSEVEIRASRRGEAMDIEVETLSDGFGPGDFTFTTERVIRSVRINGVAARRCAAQGVPLGLPGAKTWVQSGKSEIRISKSETNPKGT